MSTRTVVHYVGGPLNGRVDYLPSWGLLQQGKTGYQYKIYPTILPEQVYGIPKVWQVERLGFVDVISLESLASINFDVIEFTVDMGKSKIAKVSQEMNSLLLPLTVDTSIEEIELIEGFRVKSISISALAALPD